MTYYFDYCTQWEINNISNSTVVSCNEKNLLGENLLTQWHLLEQAVKSMSEQAFHNVAMGNSAAMLSVLNILWKVCTF